MNAYWNAETMHVTVFSRFQIIKNMDDLFITKRSIIFCSFICYFSCAEGLCSTSITFFKSSSLCVFSLKNIEFDFFFLKEWDLPSSSGIIPNIFSSLFLLVVLIICAIWYNCYPSSIFLILIVLYREFSAPIGSLSDSRILYLEESGYLHTKLCSKSLS